MSGWRHDLGGQADDPQRDRRDERDTRREPIEAVDPVDAVDHPDDPEDGQAGRDQAVEADQVRRRADWRRSDRDPEEDREAGQRDLAEQLEAGPQVEQVVDGTEAGGERAAEQEGERPRTSRN